MKRRSNITKADRYKVIYTRYEGSYPCSKKGLHKKNCLRIISFLYKIYCSKNYSLFYLNNNYLKIGCSYCGSLKSFEYPINGILALICRSCKKNYTKTLNIQNLKKDDNLIFKDTYLCIKENKNKNKFEYDRSVSKKVFGDNVICFIDGFLFPTDLSLKLFTLNNFNDISPSTTSVVFLSDRINDLSLITYTDFKYSISNFTRVYLNERFLKKFYKTSNFNIFRNHIKNQCDFLRFEEDPSVVRKIRKLYPDIAEIKLYLKIKTEEEDNQKRILEDKGKNVSNALYCCFEEKYLNTKYIKVDGRVYRYEDRSDEIFNLIEKPFSIGNHLYVFRGQMGILSDDIREKQLIQLNEVRFEKLVKPIIKKKVEPKYGTKEYWAEMALKRSANPLTLTLFPKSKASLFPILSKIEQDKIALEYNLKIDDRVALSNGNFDLEDFKKQKEKEKQKTNKTNRITNLIYSCDENSHINLGLKRGSYFNKHPDDMFMPIVLQRGVTHGYIDFLKKRHPLFDEKNYIARLKTQFVEYPSKQTYFDSFENFHLYLNNNLPLFSVPTPIIFNINRHIIYESHKGSGKSQVQFLLPKSW